MEITSKTINIDIDNNYYSVDIFKFQKGDDQLVQEYYEYLSSYSPDIIQINLGLSIAEYNALSGEAKLATIENILDGSYFRNTLGTYLESGVGSFAKKIVLYADGSIVAGAIDFVVNELTNEAGRPHWLWAR